MYATRGDGTLKRKHAYTCGNYRNRARQNHCCTTHYIRKSVLEELVLGDIQRVTKYVRAHEREFIETATKRNDAEAKKVLNLCRRERDKTAARLNELDTIFRKVYADNALGKLSDQQFSILTTGFEDEKVGLQRKLAELELEISTAEKCGINVDRFVEVVKRYTDIQELTYENLHELIDRILIYDPDPETNTRKVEIMYSFVNQVDTDDEPTSSISYLRRECNREVKSIVI